ncbi:MAG TPA: glycerol-3-phosphate acyltransferase [Candidatus Marinimicrobia bacterium]|nr:glycerol-3-phosphate acyltransferase [Candidatus Neomarinimicrobiota bacterium]HRS51877.1 glycerol-3-phosphate acyltransferase [Candidatus Neomarinimicrobiota bacterium]HRU92662.1 glycerol-3-phosphate acyltransferase [Candidatus Neomarinimicrobiota bacterium]
MVYQTIILAILAYFLGSISFSYIITKIRTGKDIRTVGVKNSGAFNVFVNVGKGLGLLAGILDALKAVVVVVIGQLIELETFPIIIAASLAVVGHCFPIYYKFHGGRGASAALGILLCYIPLEVLISCIPAALIAYFIHRMGYTPVFILGFSPIIAAIFKKPDVIIFGAIYLVLLTGVLNLVINISKRSEKLVPET